MEKSERVIIRLLSDSSIRSALNLRRRKKIRFARHRVDGNRQMFVTEEPLPSTFRSPFRLTHRGTRGGNRVAPRFPLAASVSCRCALAVPVVSIRARRMFLEVRNLHTIARGTEQDVREAQAG